MSCKGSSSRASSLPAIPPEDETVASRGSGLQIHCSDGVATVTLNRPEHLNAMTPGLMGALRAEVEALACDPEVRALVLTGAGRAFSSGGDRGFLESLLLASREEIENTVYTSFQGAVKAVKTFPHPTVAAVNGPAVGAGCELAVACDFRIAAEGAVFIESWVNLGVIAPLGGMSLLPRIVGLARAAEMLMLGKPVEAEEALRIGLVTEVVPGDDLDAAVERLAGRLAAGPPLALAAMKAGLQRAEDSTLESEWQAGVEAQVRLIGSRDLGEAVRAALEQRRPRFEGR